MDYLVVDWTNAEKRGEPWIKPVHGKEIFGLLNWAHWLDWKIVVFLDGEIVIDWS